MVYTSYIRRAFRRTGKRVRKAVDKTKTGRKVGKKFVKFSKDKGVRRVAKIARKNMANNAQTNAIFKSVLSPLYEGFVSAKSVYGMNTGAITMEYTADFNPIKIVDLTCAKNNGYSPCAYHNVKTNGAYTRNTQHLELLENLSPNPVDQNYTLGRQYLDYVNAKLCLRGQTDRKQSFKVMLVTAKKDFFFPDCHLSDTEDAGLGADILLERKAWFDQLVHASSFNPVARVSGNNKNVGRFVNVIWQKSYVINPLNDHTDKANYRMCNIYRKIGRSINYTSTYQHQCPVDLTNVNTVLTDIEDITLTERKYLCTPSNFRDRLYLIIVAQDNQSDTATIDMSVTKKFLTATQDHLHASGQSVSHGAVSIPAKASYMVVDQNRPDEDDDHTKDPSAK